MELRGRNIDDIVFFGILYIIATFLAVVDCVIHVIAYTDKDTFQVNQSGERINGMRKQPSGVSRLVWLISTLSQVGGSVNRASVNFIKRQEKVEIIYKENVENLNLL